MNWVIVLLLNFIDGNGMWLLRIQNGKRNGSGERKDEVRTNNDCDIYKLRNFYGFNLHTFYHIYTHRRIST